MAAPIAILGVPFDNVTTAETIALIEEMIASRRPHYLVTANVDFLVQALHDVELRRILCEAHLVLCDGTPLVWASRLLGNPLPERVAGSDLVPLLIRIAAEKKYRLFFLGGAPDATSLAIARMRTQHPDLIVAGHYSPPFSALLEMDHTEMTHRIRAAEPDILFVCFGCPKQEKWMAMHYRALGVPVAAGVGGTIDFLAGRRARAPLWMQRTGTEWIFRLAQEPRRLCGRYGKDLWYFIGPVLAQWRRLQLARPQRRTTVERANPVALEPEWPVLLVPERLDLDTVERSMLSWQNVLANQRCFLLDLAGVRFIDSTGVGALVQLQRRARIGGRQMYLVAPSEAVRHALISMRLERFFDLATDVEMAKAEFERARNVPPVLVKPNHSPPSLVWQGEITVANADEAWTATESYLRCQAVWQKEVRIDLAPLRFIDSSGVGVMIRAKKTASQNGLRLVFSDPQPDVRNVVRLSSLESYLLDGAS